MVRINWTLQSKEDLKEIADYISRHSKRYAKLQVDRLQKRTKVLKTQSRSGKIVSEINNEIIRELIMGSYRIIYKIVSVDQIDILTIHHSARDLKRRHIG
jgi:addiction module RelE/StbE family toxin